MSSSTEFTYGIKYTVQAETRLEAIAKATAMLRSGVELIAVQGAERVGFAFGVLVWEVRLKVAEDA
jgi:hypothetical protein